MWVVFSANQARVIATVPDIIVPRASGFWRVGVLTVCDFDTDFQQDSSHDVIWQTPIEKPPLIEESNCKSHLKLPYGPPSARLFRIIRLLPFTAGRLCPRLAAPRKPNFIFRLTLQKLAFR
jgi:hypothetical protein